MTKLNSVNITSFNEQPDRPAYVAIGGKDALGKSAEAHSVSTPLFIEAAKTILKPTLDAILEESHTSLRRFLQSLEDQKAAAIKSHQTFVRDTRRLFAMKTGQAVNETLERTVETAHGQVTVVTPAIVG